ncbi:MAG: TolC family protein [Gemmatimonadales bacterium]|nr:TolC family protein [Gemmatimonadales bacterium]NIN50704.1 TolC family protein [Gemmatimonadales bacterium]NIP08168.1 TolC family protein [Gemmatimonadales bacterium]NIR01046.1 TolC family protein [Gemmatimonadales bacterium]NIS65125.1 TolC family protein [Gemmatimonadales bacterium]
MTSSYRGRLFRAGVLLSWMSLGTASTTTAEPQRDSTLTLHEAVRLGLEYHPTVRAARASEADAAAQVGQALAQRLPQFLGQASLIHFEEPMIVAPFHRLDLSTPPRFEETLVQGQLSLGYTLFDGGARGATINGARARQEVTAARRESAEMTLIADVAGAYLQVLSAHGMLAAQDQSLDALHAERERVRRLFAEGQAARVELLRVDAAIAQAEAERIATAAELDTGERRLARLLGVEPERTRASRLTGVRLIDTVVAVDRTALIGRFESTSPDLEAARQLSQAANWGRRAAIAAWFPRLEVVGGYILFGSAAGDFTGEWQGGVRLSYPVFTGGARARAVAAASARLSVARERYRLAELGGREAIDRAVSAIRQHRAQVEAIATAVDHLVEVARIEQLALEAGAGTQTDFLTADAELRRARAGLVQARHAEIAAWVQLATTTGELSSSWLDHMVETVR